MNNAVKGLGRLTIITAAAAGLAFAIPLRAQNAAEHDDDAAVPAGNPGTWIGPDDYQAVWIARGLSGPVTVNLAVRPDGRVATCEVIRPNEAAELNQVTCALLIERARFQPFPTAQKPITRRRFGGKCPRELCRPSRASPSQFT